MQTATENKIQTLPVMESFYTIQGEGFHQGKAAYFIRLGGCDVGCVWCDVKESWNADIHPKKSVEEIVDEAVDSRRSSVSRHQTSDIVVITGGEPLMHDCTELTTQLHKAN